MPKYNKPAFLRLLNLLNAVDGISLTDSRDSEAVLVDASHSEWAGFCKGLRAPPAGVGHQPHARCACGHQGRDHQLRAGRSPPEQPGLIPWLSPPGEGFFLWTVAAVVTIANP